MWLGNVRGSKYSMKHRSLSPETKAFWQFSFHEIGMFDLPAMINYILSSTQKPSLFYFGFNQGTSALLVLLSSKPEFNEKVLQAHLLAPIAFMDHPHPLISLNLEENTRRSMLLDSFNFFSLVDRANLMLQTYCYDKREASMQFCINLWFLIFGRNSNGIIETDPSLLLEVPDHISPTASRMQWNHFMQLALNGKFQQYDHQSDSIFDFLPNVVEYNLLNVKASLYLYHAAEDLVVSRMVCSLTIFEICA